MTLSNNFVFILDFFPIKAQIFIFIFFNFSVSCRVEIHNPLVRIVSVPLKLESRKWKLWPSILSHTLTNSLTEFLSAFFLIMNCYEPRFCLRDSIPTSKIFYLLLDLFLKWISTITMRRGHQGESGGIWGIFEVAFFVLFSEFRWVQIEGFPKLFCGR